MSLSHQEKLVTSFIKAFEKADYPQMEELMNEKAVNFVTNASGGVDTLKGREAYMQRVLAMNIPEVNPSLNVTQILTTKPNQVLVMVEVKAKQDEKVLHNFATFLVNFKDDKIAEMWMVEALPAYSNAFWKG